MTPAAQRFAHGVAVVTGAGSGLGEGFALTLGGWGMHVVVTDVDADRADAVAAAVAQAGGTAEAAGLDVTRAEDVEALARSLFERYGEIRLMISNAGVEVGGRLWELDPEHWRRAFAVNVDGAFHCARSFVPRMGAQGADAVVGIVSSTGGVTALPFQSAYVASKHAALSLTECLLLDVEDAGLDVQVSAIMPNWVRSRIFTDARVQAPMVDASARAYFEAMTEMNLRDGMEPLDAAQVLLEGLAAGDFWVFSDAARTDQLFEERAAVLAGRGRPAAPGPRRVPA
jgi:NAD(P)-dependent dehydrogenase (short-subunit alcohol dehydrogenase family)